jgi:hypothetical protein
MPATIHVPTSLYPAPQRHGILPWQPRSAGSDPHTDAAPGDSANCRDSRPKGRLPAARSSQPGSPRRGYQWMPRISEAKIIASRVAVRCASPPFLPCAAAESGNIR